MKGAYVLLIEVEEDIEIEVGALGRVEFNEGKYVYVGSALNNLEKRIERHLSNDKKIFWHIDYLLSNPKAKIENVYYKRSNKNIECKIANRVKDHGDPVKDFGSSDCDCISHLFKVEDIKFLKDLMKRY